MYYVVDHAFYVGIVIHLLSWLSTAQSHILNYMGIKSNYRVNERSNNKMTKSEIPLKLENPPEMKGGHPIDPILFQQNPLCCLF